MKRLDNIDLRLLRVFFTLAEAGSFADAQIALNFSQSTLSSHLAALEEKLGGKLCRRGRGGFGLTAFGEVVLASTRKLFADIDAFSANIERRGNELVGQLRVGIVDGIVTNPKLALQGAIDRFMKSGPSVFIDLKLGTPHDLEQAIVDGRRDIVIGPLSQKAPGITYVPLHREPHALYCGAGHSLARTAAQKHDKDAISSHLFSVRRYRHLDDLYRVGHPRASASVTEMEAQVMMILSNRFIGFLPCHIGDRWVDEKKMRRLRHPAFEFDSLHFAAFQRKDAGKDLIQVFLREVKLCAR